MTGLQVLDINYYLIFALFIFYAVFFKPFKISSKQKIRF